MDQVNANQNKKFAHIDLFSGTGAVSLALKQTGRFVTTIYNDILGESKTIIKNNSDQLFPAEFFLGDIAKFETAPQIQSQKPDIITAGFPCQPFSIAGSRKGFDDRRSDVIRPMLRIIRSLKPGVILFENVKGFATHNNGKTLRVFLNTLKKIGYFSKHAILDTPDYTGIPQHRERLYIVGFLDEKFSEKFAFDFPKVQRIPFSNFLSPKNAIDKKYYYTEDSAIYNKLKETVTKFDTIYQYRRTIVRENKSGVCPTLTRNLGAGGHNVPIILTKRQTEKRSIHAIRKLTPRECFNLQGFPGTYNLDGLSDSVLYRLVGNSVCVSMIKLIAERIVRALDAQ